MDVSVTCAQPPPPMPRRTSACCASAALDARSLRTRSALRPMPAGMCFRRPARAAVEVEQICWSRRRMLATMPSEPACLPEDTGAPWPGEANARRSAHHNVGQAHGRSALADPIGDRAAGVQTGSEAEVDGLDQQRHPWPRRRAPSRRLWNGPGRPRRCAGLTRGAGQSVPGTAHPGRHRQRKSPGGVDPTWACTGTAQPYRLAEPVGFEPTVQSYPHGTLAMSWFKPLTQSSRCRNGRRTVGRAAMVVKRRPRRAARVAVQGRRSHSPPSRTPARWRSCGSMGRSSQRWQAKPTPMAGPSWSARTRS